MNFEQRCRKVLAFAERTFQKALALGAEDLSPAMKYLTVNRGFSEETIIEWGIGYAPDAWDTLKKHFIDKGYFKEAEHLGLIKTSKGNNYDAFRNRIMFPIHDHRKQLVGFGGRDFSGESKAKYLNSDDSTLYKKQFVLYGLDKAMEAIRAEKLAYLTEGYTDVIAMHQAGLNNTVASCGTALTEFQCKLLKRYCNHVVIMRDGDPAGQKAAERDVQLLLNFGFKVDICQLPENEDPDSLCRKMTAEELVIPQN